MKASYLLVVAIIGVLAGAITAEVITHLLTVPSQGNITLEYGLIAEPSTVNWGTMQIGVPKQCQINITNVGTKNVASLNLTSGNAINLTSYEVSWDWEGESLPVGYYIEANFQLIVYEASAETFSLDLIINDKGA